MAIQSNVLLISLVLMAVVAGFFISAVRANRKPDTGAPREVVRTRFIYALLTVGVIVTAVSLRPWPHAISAANGPSATVNVTGAMWYWEIDRETVPLGVPVIFNARTTDVTHGFGVMDSQDRLLFQTQAMPGYVNQVEHVFRQPGVYRVVCMEYCGVAHHAMTNEFTVAAAN
jgi:cytochrome c oxidase subunit 2